MMRRHFAEHVVDENRRVGQDDALDGAVRNVALVPERDVFVRGDHVGAHDARQAADLFAAHGIALVRHRRTAALLAAERLFGFAHFGALQMANLRGDFFESRRDKCQRADELRVAIALDHLRGDWSDVSPRRLQMCASMSGPRCEALPTAPEIFPIAICAAASRKRPMLR